MSKNTNICQICLHTDRKLQVIDNRLSEFHDELCDFSLQTVDPQYCMECGQMLRKLYNFKVKCVLAFKIFRKWKKTKAAEKKPLNLLYTLLPPTSLGLWNPTNSTIYSYICQDDPGSISSVNVLRIDPALNVNIRSSQPHIVIVPIETIFEETQHVDENDNQEFQENSLQTENIKLEIECEADVKTLHLQDVLTLKTEDSTKLFEEILLENDSSLLNAEDNEYVKLQNEDIDDVLDDSSSNSDDDEAGKVRLSKNSDDNDIDDIRERKNSSDDDTEKIIHRKNSSDNDKDKKTHRKYTTDESNNHCRKKIKLNSNSRRKKSFTELDNIPLAFNNFDDITEQESDTKNNDNKTQRSPRKRKIVDNNDDKKRRRVRKRTIDKDEKKKERFHTKKDILAELANIVDAVDENCEKIGKRGKLSFNKERLKAELNAKFAACGELTIDDGVVVDKSFIMNSLDDKVTEFVMRQLWKAIHGKSTLKPKALKLLKCIQNKYKNEYESVFDIEYLNTKEKMLEEFQRRKSYECYVTAEFKCEMCFQGFKHEKKLEYHKKCHDESAGEFVCSICSVRQRSKKSLISHVNSHEAVYKCKLCPLVTYYKCSMVNHYQLHNGVKFRCEPCDATFGSQSAYRTHVSYRHQRQHVCTACGRAFCTQVGLKWHTTRAHQDEVPSVAEAARARCPQCALSFPTQDACRRHVRITHEAVTKGRPPGSTSTYKSTQKPRMGAPRKKPVIVCRVCNAVGSSIGWLNLHFRMEHPSTDMALVYADKHTHLCDVCGKGFTTIYTLRDHLNAHSGVRPFACGACPARFPRALSLRAHRAAHAPPARGCSYCGKKFRSQSNLTNHVRFHIGERHYKCKICGKGFLHRGTLNEHVRGVHHHVRRVRRRGGGRGGAGASTGGVTETEMSGVIDSELTAMALGTGGSCDSTV